MDTPEELRAEIERLKGELAAAAYCIKMLAAGFNLTDVMLAKLNAENWTVANDFRWEGLRTFTDRLEH